VPVHSLSKTPVAPDRPPGAKSRPRRKRRQQTQTRQVGLQHFAFFRRYLEGLELSGLADQYLEFGRDARKATATRIWLVSAFVAAARKREDFATARLLAIRPATLATTSAARTSWGAIGMRGNTCPGAVCPCRNSGASRCAASCRWNTP
jgi:hypothetical protein